MKKIRIAMCFMAVSLCSVAQDDKRMIDSKQDSVYCLVMKDGLSVLTSSSGRVVNNEITLSNGTRINPRGVITKKDGKQIIMKDGDCTNTLGEPMDMNSSEGSGIDKGKKK